MIEQLIKLETAKLAKEKGFYQLKDLPAGHPIAENCWEYSGRSVNPEWEINSFGEAATEVIIAPTQSLLQKYLREKHTIIVTVLLDRGKYDTPFYPWDDIQQDEVFFQSIIHNKDGLAHIIDGGCETYEKALELGLQQGLKLIKNE